MVQVFYQNSYGKVLKMCTNGSKKYLGHLSGRKESEQGVRSKLRRNRDRPEQLQQTVTAKQRMIDANDIFQQTMTQMSSR